MNGITPMQIEKLPSSFRDPDGFMFQQDGKLYRRITEKGMYSYQLLMNSGLYETLIQKKLLVSHAEISSCKETGALTIRPEAIKLISYPYEWSFSQLKDAALHTLTVQKYALDHNMMLKDASAYNIQFMNGKTIFIDTLSFEEFQPTPWKAYKQFCQHFLAPLFLSSYIDHRLTKLMASNIDGIPLDIASKLLPARSYLNLGSLLHIHMHAKFQKAYGDDNDSAIKPIHKKMDINRAKALVNFLETSISKLKKTKKNTEWASYYENTNYSETSMKEKITLVDEKIKKINPRVLVDLGANNGEFSRIAAKHCDTVISLDIDEVAVEYNYIKCKENNLGQVIPLIQDLTNPSPAIGWNNQERLSISDRCKGDAALALALVHHLAISNNLPLWNIAQFLSSIAPNLIIEFVPKSDSQVKRLLKTREDIFPLYTEEGFESAFKSFYSIQTKDKIQDTERTLYVMKKLEN
ncbi:MAG: class I SAM-dependent methyltransferase [Porticoccaceae bacterium]